MSEIVSLDEVFHRRVFTVPDYQRGYAWGEKQWVDLLDDLDDMPTGKSHYTGTLVLHARGTGLTDRDRAAYTPFDVVDGQQRLTTLVVLLSVIAREFRALGENELADSVLRRFVATVDRHGQPFHKLRLAEPLHTYFAGAVLPDDPTITAAPATAAAVRLRDARTHFTKYFSEQRGARADFPSWLDDLYTKVTEHLRVTVYPIEDAAEVGVIFEVMNDRGRPLTELEKVKNYLLYLGARLDASASQFRDRVNAAWAFIYERLMGAELSFSADEDQLLRAHWIATFDHDARKWEGTRSVKARFNAKRYRGREDALLGELFEYVDSLRNAVVPFVDARQPTRTDAYGALLDPTTRDEARRWGDKLSRMGVVAPFIPLIIATRLRNPTDGQVIVDLLKMCETFAFRVYRLGGLKSNTGQSNLYQQAHLRYDGKTDDPKVIENVRGLLHWYHGEHKVPERLAEKPRDEDNNWYNWYGLRYFLYEWEEHRAGAIGVKKPWSEVSERPIEETVEHILPQSATDPYWQQHFTDAERTRYTHDLGNLVLTQYNPSLSNKDFDTKKGTPTHGEKRYANSNLASERELASLTAWNVTELKKRRQAMVEWATQRWSAPRPTATPVAPLPDDEEG